MITLSTRAIDVRITFLIIPIAALRVLLLASLKATSVSSKYFLVMGSGVSEGGGKYDDTAVTLHKGHGLLPLG